MAWLERFRGRPTKAIFGGAWRQLLRARHELMPIRHPPGGGIAVHIGARVTSLAGAGEVLVSSTVKDLLAGTGLRVSEHGIRSLKGVPAEWRIFAVDR